MDIRMSQEIEQKIQYILEERREELNEFILDSNTTFHAAKALVSFILAEHFNRKQEADNGNANPT